MVVFGVSGVKIRVTAYGQCWVALNKVSMSSTNPLVLGAFKWLLKIQNEDAGWGESLVIATS
jgi:hypothetical protein